MTNTTPTGAYRGAGRPEAAYMIERMMDAIARELSLDPVEVRRRNFIPPDAFPYMSATGIEYDSGNYDLALTEAWNASTTTRCGPSRPRRAPRDDWSGLAWRSTANWPVPVGTAARRWCSRPAP